MRAAINRMLELVHSEKVAPASTPLQEPPSQAKAPELPADDKGTLSVHEVGGVVVVNLTGGRVGWEGTIRLARRVQELLAAAHKKFLLIFAPSDVWSAAASIRALLDCHKLVEKHGGQLKLIVRNQQVSQGLEATKLSKSFEIYASESEALASFSPADASAASAFPGESDLR